MLGKEGLVVFCRCCGVQGWPERCGWWRTPSCAAVKPEYPAAAAHCWLRHWSDRPRSPATGWCRLWSPQGLSSCLVPKQRIQNKDTTSIKDIVCTTMKSLSSVTRPHAIQKRFDFLSFTEHKSILKNVGNHWLPLYGQETDSNHPGNHLFRLLPSGRRYRSLMAKTERLRKSFFPQAIRLLNTNSVP